VLRVEPDADEHLMRPRAYGEAQIVAHRARRGERAARFQFLPGRAARKLDRRGELRPFRLPQSLELRRGRGFLQKPRDASKPLEKFASQVDRALAPHPASQ
jgi:hypothetical protein